MSKKIQYFLRDDRLSIKRPETMSVRLASSEDNQSEIFAHKFHDKKGKPPFWVISNRWDCEEILSKTERRFIDADILGESLDILKENSFPTIELAQNHFYERFCPHELGDIIWKKGSGKRWIIERIEEGKVYVNEKGTDHRKYFWIYVVAYWENDGLPF